ncbi:hypothetical protein Dda_6840 [Drechslerella dactyloides]|uniref:Chorismate mutase n=1 Tax=Drechslerella dactyloides TaxID=74499 RepID=A0AAD6IUQ9_DREDA|nr:hypothetical protein Dda_6840 [Drechslerella dactyloides]
MGRMDSSDVERVRAEKSVKYLHEDPGKPFPKFYIEKWYKLGFFTTWNSAGRKSILCMNCPVEFATDVRTFLQETEGCPYEADPFWFHQIIVGALLNFYDTSICPPWGASPQSRSTQNLIPTAKYWDYHELMTHVIHSKETLLVSTETVFKIMHRQREWQNRMFTTATTTPHMEKMRRYSTQVYDDLNCYHTMLFSLKCRQEGMEGRHQNEVDSTSLAVAQYHSGTAMEDSRAMKVIAVLTVVFLPGTFVSAVFSMSFFEADASNISVSKSFWIYWAFAIPLTIPYRREKITTSSHNHSNRDHHHLNLRAASQPQPFTWSLAMDSTIDLLDPSKALDLNYIRYQLIRLEDTIVFTLIERAQFPLNPTIYTPTALPVPDFSGSFMDWMLFQQESIYARVRRYQAPDEYPFFPEVLAVQPILKPLAYPKLLHPNTVNVNERIKDVYVNTILPAICRRSVGNAVGGAGDDEGDRGEQKENYGSSAVADVAVLQALSRRIHFGKFVAEAKFREDVTGFTRLIEERNGEEIGNRITKKAVEEEVLRRLRYKAKLYGRDPTLKPDEGGLVGQDVGVGKIDVEAVVRMYRDIVIPLTKDVEVEYLLQRLVEPKQESTGTPAGVV